MRPASNSFQKMYSDPKYVFWFLILVIVIGMRHEIGGDWYNYIKMMKNIEGQNFIDSIYVSDPLFNFLIWFGGNIWGGLYIVNLVCAVLFSWALLIFCRSQKRPELALLIAIPYLVIVVSMGYVRQGVGIGLGLLSIVYLLEKKFFRFLILIFLAACFHKVSLIYFSLAVLIQYRNRFLVTLGVILLVVFFASFFAYEYILSVINQNMFGERDSKGTFVRLFMLWIPALVFLTFRKKFKFKQNEENFWTWVSVSTFFFIPLFIITDNTTIVDRLALFWIPLQIVILSRIPDAFGVNGEKNAAWVYSIIIFEAIVMFVWLFFSPSSSAWLPYEFYPFIWAF